jgi:DNA-PKcs, CC5
MFAGDFPDFYFNALALLLPLKSLVKKDNSIARDIFITIFESIIRTYQESEDKEGETAFFTAINEAIIRIVKSTQQTYSFLVTTLIEMTMKTEKYLDIHPDDLKILPANGILFLESQIMHLMERDKMLENEQEESQEEVERPSKRQKLEENYTKHQQHWLKLIELNYQLKEYEVITGIFMEKLNLRQDIKAQLLRCIDFEAEGKHKDARSIYKQLLIANDYRNQHEKQFYYNSYFNCLANLSDWKEVLQDVQQQLGGYNEIWNENTPFYQNTLLPQLIKGELRITLNNEQDDMFFAVSFDYLASIL